MEGEFLLSEALYLSGRLFFTHQLYLREVRILPLLYIGVANEIYRNILWFFCGE